MFGGIFIASFFKFSCHQRSQTQRSPSFFYIASVFRALNPATFPRHFSSCWKLLCQSRLYCLSNGCCFMLCKLYKLVGWKLLLFRWKTDESQGGQPYCLELNGRAARCFGHASFYCIWNTSVVRRRAPSCDFSKNLWYQGRGEHGQRTPTASSSQSGLGSPKKPELQG